MNFFDKTISSFHVGHKGIGLDLERHQVFCQVRCSWVGLKKLGKILHGVDGLWL